MSNPSMGPKELAFNKIEASVVFECQTDQWRKRLIISIPFVPQRLEEQSDKNLEPPHGGHDGTLVMVLVVVAHATWWLRKRKK